MSSRQETACWRSDIGLSLSPSLSIFCRCLSTVLLSLCVCVCCSRCFRFYHFRRLFFAGSFFFLCHSRPRMASSFQRPSVAIRSGRCNSSGPIWRPQRARCTPCLALSSSSAFASRKSVCDASALLYDVSVLLFSLIYYAFLFSKAAGSAVFGS